MNFMSAALKGRKKEDGTTDAAPKSAAMPGDEMPGGATAEEGAQDPIAMIVEALKAKPELLMRVQQMLTEEGSAEAEEGDESDDMEEAIMGKMSEEQKPGFMARKPKGLGERATRAVIEKQSKPQVEEV